MFREIEGEALKIEVNGLSQTIAKQAKDIERMIARRIYKKEGFTLLKEKADLYVDLMLLQYWLDDKISEFEVELSNANAEIYLTEKECKVITRSVSDGKATFVEPISKSDVKSSNAQKMGKQIKNKNLTQ